MTRVAATADDLGSGLALVRAAPRDEGVVELIVRRPAVDEREALEEAELDAESGLLGDSWSRRGRNPNPKAQLTLMNVRAAALVAGERERWALAGDQLLADLDLSEANLPPGTRLAVGEAIIEVTEQPHAGCKKFVERFGRDAHAFVNSALGKRLRLRGLNARVVEPGTIRAGDPVNRIRSPG